MQTSMLDELHLCLSFASFGCPHGAAALAAFANKRVARYCVRSICNIHVASYTLRGFMLAAARQHSC